MSDQDARSAARDRQHLPPDDGGMKPTVPPPKPSDARRSVTAVTVEQRPCPWCKTPGYPDDPYCLYCGRTRAEAEEEIRHVKR